MSKPTSDDKFNALLTIMRHREEVAEGCHRIADYFRARAREHDRSKLRLDEFDGFAGINRIAREHPFGSDAYNKSMEPEKEEGGCIALHFSRNAHHPEFHVDARFMRLFDLMEMVIDWHGAAKTYGTNTLRDSLKVQRRKLDLADWQWQVVDDMVDFLDPPEDG